MTDKLFTKRLRDLTDEAIRESLAEISVELEKRFGPAALTASPPVVEREVIARIIDPEAFLTLREIAAEKGLDAANPPPGIVLLDPIDGPRNAFRDRHDAALAKADAILALTPVAQGGEVRDALAERLEQISFTHFSAGLPGSIMEANRATIDQTIAILRQGQTDATLAAIKAWADTSLMRDHTPRELGAIYGGDVETAAQKTLATLTKGARDAG